MKSLSVSNTTKLDALDGNARISCTWIPLYSLRNPSSLTTCRRIYATPSRSGPSCVCILLFTVSIGYAANQVMQPAVPAQKKVFAASSRVCRLTPFTGC